MTDRPVHPPTDYRAIIIVAAIVAAMINGAVIGYALWVAAQKPYVELTPPIMEGDTVVCPGDTLNYRFTLTLSKGASVDLYTSIHRLIPPDRVSYTRLQQFNWDEPTEMEFIRHFVMPPNYIDPVSAAEVVWLPGQYIQRTTANVVGRTELSEIEVQFTIPPDCK